MGQDVTWTYIDLFKSINQYQGLQVQSQVKNTTSREFIKITVLSEHCFGANSI